MNEIQDSPFMPGCRVAVRSRHGDSYREGFVEKVHKNGRFTLKGSPQQWRPWCAGKDQSEWRAIETGDSWIKNSLQIWDASTDAEIQARIAQTKRRDKWSMLSERMRRLSADKFTDEMLDQIEAALPPINE